MRAANVARHSDSGGGVYPGAAMEIDQHSGEILWRLYERVI